MDLLKDDLSRENLKIKDKITNSIELNEDDLKIILLSLLQEEEVNENK